MWPIIDDIRAKALLVDCVVCIHVNRSLVQSAHDLAHEAKEKAECVFVYLLLSIFFKKKNIHIIVHNVIILRSYQ